MSIVQTNQRPSAIIRRAAVAVVRPHSDHALPLSPLRVDTGVVCNGNDGGGRVSLGAHIDGDRVVEATLRRRQ